MKRIAVLIFGIFAIIVASLFPFTDALADDKSCMLKALVDDVFVTVWDEDSGQDMDGPK
jgi:uncharacterized protein YxeA